MIAIKQWDEKWDDYNDLAYWQHRETSAVRYDRPEIPQYLPDNYSPPVPPTVKVSDLSESEPETESSDSSDSSRSDDSSDDDDEGE